MAHDEGRDDGNEFIIAVERNDLELLRRYMSFPSPTQFDTRVENLKVGDRLNVNYDDGRKVLAIIRRIVKLKSGVYRVYLKNVLATQPDAH